MRPDTTENKIAFIRKYMKAQNAATGSDVDQNANVSNKNIATMAAELPKKDIINATKININVRSRIGWTIWKRFSTSHYL